MCNNRNKYVAILLVFALLYSPFFRGKAEEQSIETGTDLSYYYETMLYYFKVQMYDEAQEYIEENDLDDYGDTEKYTIYMKAIRDYNDTMDILMAEAGENARDVKAEALDRIAVIRDQFEALANIEFEDSDKWSSYLSALLLELNGNYETAIEGYKSVILFRDSAERMSVCHDQLRSISQNNAEQIQQEAYIDALEKYGTAQTSCDVETMKAAMTLFEQLGDYRDSANRVKECSEWLAGANRVMSLLAAPISYDTIGIDVTDSNGEDGTRYLATLTPIGCSNPTKSIEFAGNRVEVDGLLPNTDYQVTVNDAENTKAGAAAETKTYAAPVWQEGAVKVSYRSLYAFNRIYLGMFSESEILSDFRILERQDGQTLALSTGNIDEQEKEYVAMLTFDDSFSSVVQDGRAHSVYWMLRVENGGTYASKPQSIVFSGKTVSILLETLLGNCYNDLGGWPNSGLTLEVYIDNAVAGRMTLQIGQPAGGVG